MTKQIMVVDDDAQTRALVGLVLQRCGYKTLEAFDGQSALRLLDFTTPDLLIVDVMMPGIDGLELCRRLRARQQTTTTPIIVFSAAGSTKLERASREAGANEFLPKTSPPQELLSVVQRLLGVGTVDLSC